MTMATTTTTTQPSPSRLRTSLHRPLTIALGALAVLALPLTATAAPPTTASHGALQPEVAYDGLRAALANDDPAAAASEAMTLQRAAAVAAKSAAQPTKLTLQQLAGAAGEVAKAARAGMRGAGDLATARTAFGKASKLMITLAAEDPALAKRVTVYRCPMTKTYKKWLQLSGPMANPYMGKRMLHCGSKVPVQP